MVGLRAVLAHGRDARCGAGLTVNGGADVSQNWRFGIGSFSGKQPAGATAAAFRMCLRSPALRKRNGKKE
jgi:hypothetical protein